MKDILKEHLDVKGSQKSKHFELDLDGKHVVRYRYVDGPRITVFRLSVRTTYSSVYYGAWIEADPFDGKIETYIVTPNEAVRSIFRNEEVARKWRGYF